MPLFNNKTHYDITQKDYLIRGFFDCKLAPEIDPLVALGQLVGLSEDEIKIVENKT